MALHSDGLFSTLWGTVKGAFHIGGPDNACIAVPPSEPTILRTLGADESAWARHEAKAIRDTQDANLNQLSTYIDLTSKFVNIIAGFAGATPPSGADEKGFYICSGSGGSFNENDIVYWDGSSNTKVYKSTGNIDDSMTNSECLTHITTQAAIDMATTGDLLENALYAWELVTGVEQWVLKGYAGAGNDMKVIKIAIGTTASYTSTTPVPANAYISRVVCKITTAYSAAATVAVSITAQSIMAATDLNAQIVNTYEKSEPKEIAAGGVVTVTIGGAPAAGVGIVYVEYGYIYS